MALCRKEGNGDSCSTTTIVAATCTHAEPGKKISYERTPLYAWIWGFYACIWRAVFHITVGGLKRLNLAPLSTAEKESIYRSHFIPTVIVWESSDRSSKLLGGPRRGFPLGTLGVTLAYRAIGSGVVDRCRRLLLYRCLSCPHIPIKDAAQHLTWAWDYAMTRRTTEEREREREVSSGTDLCKTQKKVYLAYRFFSFFLRGKGKY